MMRAAWLVGLGLAGCLVAAHTAVWIWAERTLRREVAAWVAAEQAHGLAIAIAASSVSGWPLAARLTLADVTIGPAGLPFGAVLRTARAKIGVSLLDPRLLRIALPEPVRLTLPRAPTIAATASDWRIETPLPQADRITMDATGWRADWDFGTRQTLTAALAHASVAPASAATKISLSAEAITLPAAPNGGDWPLGRRLASVSGDATLRPPLTDIGSRAALAGWRDLGGQLDISRAAFGYGPLGVSGRADLTLDETLQPLAKADLRVLGGAATLDALSQGHVLTGSAAVAAKAVLSLLTRVPDGGGAAVAELSVELRQGTLSVAGFPMAKLPPIAWQLPP